jgi:phosphoserine phosphatase
MTQHPYAITLIADPDNAPLKKGLLVDLAKKLEKVTGGVETKWLADKEACDLFFKSDNIQPVRVTLREALSEAPLDWAIVPMRHRKKKLLICDMDSTMIEQECIDELADFAGLKEKISAITERAMRGELDFKEALKERVALLKDLNAELLEQCYKERITFTPGGRELVRTMNGHGAHTLLVSGGFTFFTNLVGTHLGFDGDLANVLEIAGGKLTGSVKQPILDKNAKLTALQVATNRLELVPEQSVAVGDGANDVPMIEAAGLGVGFRGKEVVQKAATVNLTHSNLTAVLYLQGYQKQEFITD